MKSGFVYIKREVLTGGISLGFEDGKWRLLFSLQKISDQLHSRMHLSSYNINQIKTALTTQSTPNQEKTPFINFDPSQKEKRSQITYKTVIFLKLYLECPKRENKSPSLHQLAGWFCQKKLSISTYSCVMRSMSKRGYTKFSVNVKKAVRSLENVKKFKTQSW